jgi:glycine/D-amino acid oxidase-like deaminating enzyme
MESGTPTSLPATGNKAGQMRVAAGYSGHGNVLGFICGELVAAAILGAEDPLLELFSPARLLQLEAS